jgi:hypothetical protein
MPPTSSPHEILPSWKYLTSFNRGLTTTCELCPPRPYLSLTIPKDEKNTGNNVVVRRAVFTTLSHDQGFSSSNPELDGSYEDSNTFLEVRVVDSLGQDRVPHERLTRNRRADFEFFEHVICWDFRDRECWFRDEKEELPPFESGLIPAQWLAAIRSGDVVQVVPRAQFPAWVNYLVEVRIELWVEVVQEESIIRPISVLISRTTYQPLRQEEKEIRVVVIESSDHVDQPVRLTLRRTSLANQDRLLYEALSYCWGDGYEVVPISLVDDAGSLVELLVSSNLEHAIRRIRQPDKDRLFWIDLLSINQNDMAERSQQVAMVSEIYASAQSVCVWIGEIDEIVHTQKDIEVIQTVAVSCAPDKTREEADSTVLDVNGNTNWFNDRIFLRPWFQRVWVLQEVWNAASAFPTQDDERRHRVSVLCGEFTIPWWVIMQANACLFRGFRIHKNNTMPSLWMDLFDVPRRLHDPWMVVPGNRMDILSLVIRGLDFKASDPRDRIFALLGFGQETYQVSRLPALVKPDYNKTTAQVFCDFTLWWIREYRSLRILSAVHTLRKRTWVDLSEDHSFRQDDDLFEPYQQPTWTVWSNGDSTWARGTLALNEPHAYRACRENSIDIQLLEDDRSKHGGWFVPTFRGIQMGTIVSIQAYDLAHLAQPQRSDMAKAFIRVFDPTGDQGTWRNTKSSLGEVVDAVSDDVECSVDFHTSLIPKRGHIIQTICPA